MVSINKNILRSVLIISYLILIVLIISGISALFTYLNTGADRSLMLHKDVKKAEQYLPKIIWAPLQNEGRSMDSVGLKALEDNYLDAWFVKHVAYKTNTLEGIKDYYTKGARQNIYNFINHNKSEGITVESTTLEHHPTLEFFSEDGQLAVITDKDVIEYKRIFIDNESVAETTEKATYKIVLLLEDGFWRIRHKVKEQVENYDPATKTKLSGNLNIKGINYYPQATPWNMFSDTFSKDIISADFKIIKNANLNSVRLFVPYNDFGKAKIDANKLEKLKQTLDAAHENNLKVVLTLFDFYGDYSVLDWTLTQRHATAIVSQFKDHKALIAWDIKNEPNLDFDTRGRNQVIAWLNSMIDLVKDTDPNHPVTIGWSNTKSASILSDKVDFISFHYYENIANLNASIKTLKEELPNKTIVLQEFGMSSYNGFWNPFGNSEEDQTKYHKDAQRIIADNDLQYMSWTLYDFNKTPKEVVGRLPWRKNNQKKFGFIDIRGEKKGSFKHISQP